MTNTPNPYLNNRPNESRVEHILVVDDDDKMLLILKGGLEMAGFEVSSAHSVGDAEQLLNSRRYDLVISDVIMPDRGGVDLLRWSQQLSPCPAFILITGNPNADLVMDALNTGAHFFMRKPFKLTELHEAVSSVLAKQRYAQSREDFRLQLEENNRVLRQRLLDAVVQQETLFLGCLSALAETIDARDPYTRQHSASVASLARLMARKMKLSSEDVHAAETAGMLHDIGKIAVPESILKKPTKLNDEEFAIMKEHPERAAVMLMPVPGLDRALPAIRAHHEFYNGDGYPGECRGDEIPLLARILGVCDTWDAMTSDRPYRKALHAEMAISEIHRCSGHQFDPKISSIFIELVDEGIIKPSQPMKNKV